MPIHLRTTLTTRAPAALVGISQAAVDRIIHHRVPVPARSPTPTPDEHRGPWIIDDTPIPVHDQSITTPAKNYRRSINTQLIICSNTRTVATVGRCWPGNRNDVIAARHTVAHLHTSTHQPPRHHPRRRRLPRHQHDHHTPT